MVRAEPPARPLHRTAPDRPTVAITMGDPYGIGPEIIVKALMDPEVRRGADFRIYGADAPLAAASLAAGVAPFWDRVPLGAGPALPPPSDRSGSPGEAGKPGRVVLVDWPTTLPAWRPGTDGPNAGAALIAGRDSLEYCERAIADAKAMHADPHHAWPVHAIATAPINKAHWSAASKGEWAGHTELFGARFAADRFRMMFISPVFRVVLHSVHIPLRAVVERLRSDQLAETIEMADEACRSLGIGAPKIAVCGVDPHAGEQGVIGVDDDRTVAPAVAMARGAGVDASGPHPADTVFNKARLDREDREGRSPEFDCVVAIYHDQGLIPVKLLSWESAVNVTIGLPTPRTSPDHGTAFDIAGRNVADHRSMSAAIRLAVDLARDGESVTRDG